MMRLYTLMNKSNIHKYLVAIVDLCYSQLARRCYSQLAKTLSPYKGKHLLEQAKHHHLVK